MATPPAPPDDRQRLLAAASRLLQEEGPHALSNRRIAEAAGCTTMAIYSRFGSKLGLVDALYREGLDVLEENQRGVAEARPDPVEALVALTLAYRKTARERPGHYAILFGNPVPGFTPSPQSAARGLEAFARLEAAVERCRAAGRTGPGAETRPLAYRIFTACHGLVSAENAGFPAALGVADPEAEYRAVVLGLLAA